MPTTSCPTAILELGLLGWCSRCAASDQRRRQRRLDPSGGASFLHTKANYANVNAVVGKYYFNSFRPTSELIRDLQRIGEVLQKGQLPL